MHQIQNFPELRPGPRWGAHSASTDSLAGGRGLAALERRPFEPRTQQTHILFRGAAYESTTIRLRSDYDVSRSTASIRREQK